MTRKGARTKVPFFSFFPLVIRVKIFSGGAFRNYSKISNCHKNVKCLEEFLKEGWVKTQSFTCGTNLTVSVSLYVT